MRRHAGGSNHTCPLASDTDFGTVPSAQLDWFGRTIVPLGMVRRGERAPASARLGAPPARMDPDSQAGRRLPADGDRGERVGDDLGQRCTMHEKVAVGFEMVCNPLCEP